MAKRDPLEARLAEIVALRDGGKTPAALAALADALSNKLNLVVAKAAHVAAQLNATKLVSDLERAFPRFMRNPTTADRGCAAKTAIATALYEMGASSQELFLTGIRHRQLEAAWGPPRDTAAELRGACALGLVRIGYRGVLDELADLLADPEPAARTAAARALAYTGNDLALPLLRLKAQLGDDDPQVTAECLSGIVHIAPARAVAFLTRFIHRAGEPELRDVALAALGESRQPEAFAFLKQTWQEDFSPGMRAALVTPLALLRLPEAIDFLLDAIERAGPDLARAALEAMQMYRNDPMVRDRVLEMADRAGGEVQAHAQRLFRR